MNAMTSVGFRRRLAALMLAVPLLLVPAGSALAAETGHPSGDPELIKFPPGRTELITSITTLLIFCILIAVLGKFAWAPIVSGLRKREEKIRKEIADAEAARERAEQTLREYNTRL